MDELELHFNPKVVDIEEAGYEPITIWTRISFFKWHKHKLYARVKKMDVSDLKIDEFVTAEVSLDVKEVLEDRDLWVWEYWWCKWRGSR